MQFSDERELLIYAIHKEESAHRFYQNLAATIKNPEATRVFTDMATDEADHRRQLESRWSTIFSDLIPFDEESIDLRSPGIDQQAGAVQALDLALEAEATAAKFYEETAAASEDPALRNLCSDLARQEWAHFETLNAEKNAIIESFYWFDVDHSAYVED